jgi:hypothetical protein
LGSKIGVLRAFRKTARPEHYLALRRKGKSILLAYSLSTPNLKTFLKSKCFIEIDWSKTHATVLLRGRGEIMQNYSYMPTGIPLNSANINVCMNCTVDMYRVYGKPKHNA